MWRSMLQWFGGIGIIVVAMVFLPELRIGGMQIFRSEAFDTMGKSCLVRLKLPDVSPGSILR